MTKPKEHRAFHLNLDLRQSPLDVWQALTDADEVTHWFPPKATVQPGEGGRIKWSWEGFGCFDLEICTWEPGQRLVLNEKKQNKAGNPVVHSLDFSLQEQATGCQLTLVHSGFGLESEWDDEFNGICAGWTFELRVLRHYLNHHQGKPRHLALWTVPGNGHAENLYQTILGTEGFCATGNIDGLQEGDPVTMRSAKGDNLDGTVLVHTPPNSYAAVVPAFGNGIFRYEREGNEAFIALETWGDREAETRAFQERWQTHLADLVTA